MPVSTKLFMQFPWDGGLNLNLDPSAIPASQLTEAQNIIIGERGSKKKREGVTNNWDDVTTGSLSILGLHDFWFGSASKTQRLVSVASDGSIRSYVPSTGAHTVITGGTAWTAPVRVSFEVMNNLLLIATDESGKSPKKWSGSGNAADLGGTPPQCSIMRQHLGRVWTNDKTNVDRLHYSTTANPEEWNGAGDSGAIDIGIGDGDPEGITAIFPSFNGALYVAKRTKIYRISSYTPETFLVELISNGVGCISHNSVCAIDQSDVYFISDRGVHSLAATQNFGDTTSQFVSYDIQNYFNENWRRARLKFSWGAYLNTVNSVAFAVTDSNFSETANTMIYLYNIVQKAWYRWFLPCDSLIVANDTDKRRLYLGRADSRITKTFSGNSYDTSTAGANFNIPQVMSSGFIFPEGVPFKVYHFKKFGIIYKPTGTHTITGGVTIDNNDVQALSFSTNDTTTLLGSTFVLGSSILGYSTVMSAYTQQVDGVGRSIKMSLGTNGAADDTEIWGFFFEYEDAEYAQETISNTVVSIS